MTEPKMMTPLENALSDALSARLGGKPLSSREVINTARLTGEAGGLLETLGRYDPAGLVNILAALVDCPNQAPRFATIRHALLIWTLREVCLPMIDLGEGIGQAIPTCRYAIKHLDRNDLDYGQWLKLADHLNTILSTVKGPTSRGVVTQFWRVVATKADRKFPARQLPILLGTLKKDHISQVSAKLCELIRVKE